MFSVTGTVFLPGEPSSCRVKSLKGHQEGAGASRPIHHIYRRTELISLSVSIGPLIRKKTALTASSLEASR